MINSQAPVIPYPLKGLGEGFRCVKRGSNREGAMNSDKSASPAKTKESRLFAVATPESRFKASPKDQPGDGRLRLAFDTAPIGMAIFGPDYRLHRVNRALCEALDYKEEELLARSFTEVTEPIDGVNEKEIVDKLFSGELRSYRGEQRNKTRKGDVVWFDLAAVVVRDEDGEPLYGLAMIENITERKRAAEKLRASEERYRSFVANSTEGIWRFEIEQPVDITRLRGTNFLYQHGYLAECNDAIARMYGHSCADDLLGARFGDFALVSNPTSISRMRKFISNGYRLQNLETHELDSTGSQRYFVLNVVGIVINGRLLRLWGTQRDETQRRLAEESVKDSQQRLRSLAARIQALREQERIDIAREMHDVLGQSLTSVRMDLSWLKRKFTSSSDSPADKEIEERTTSAIHEVEKTIAAVKTLSTELRPGVLDKFGLAATIEWQCQEFERRTGVNCTCHVPAEELALATDRSTALFRILQEALVNVTRHSRASNVKIDLLADNEEAHPESWTMAGESRRNRYQTPRL